MQTLKVTNKYGEIKVNNNATDSVTVDVEITVDASSESSADDLLDLININFSKSGSTVSAETDIDSEFRTNREFSIDYTINIPSDKNLNISNKYGNTIINTLNASGDFDIQYGNYIANELNKPGNGHMIINLDYGRGTSEVNSANDLDVNVKYSTMSFGEVNTMHLMSRYSVVNVEKSGNLNIDSRYDTFNFEDAESVTAETRYSHFEINKLKRNLDIDSQYGGIKVDEVPSDFESISVENSYGQIRLGLDDGSNYSLDASCNYCGISFPKNKFSGNSMQENHSQTLQGTVGNNTGGKVYIRSKYGEIKLQ